MNIVKLINIQKELIFLINRLSLGKKSEHYVTQKCEELNDECDLLIKDAQGGTDIFSIKWNSRIKEVFLREGITTIEKLVLLTTNDLLCFKNFGHTSLAIVNDKLEEAGFPKIK